MPTESPASAAQIIWKEKTWEKLPVTHPTSEAFALPFYRDKQLSQPTPMRIIIEYIKNLLPALSHTDIIHPRGRFIASIFL